MKGSEKLIKMASPKIYLSVHPKWLDKLGQSVSELKRFINASVRLKLYRH